MSNPNQSEIRLGDIYMPVIPNNSVVRKMVVHIKRGHTLPPFTYDGVRKEYWNESPGGRTFAGVGFRVLEGRNRVAAYKIAFGDDYVTPAICSPKKPKVHKEETTQNDSCRAEIVL